MSASTPFWYGAQPATIVALFPDVEGVRFTAQQQLSDSVWRDLCDLRFTWADFAELVRGAGEIMADPQSARAKIKDYPDIGDAITCGAVT